MCVLLDKISSDVLVNLWSEWTDIPDLAYLDSALCSKAFRAGFLELISNNNLEHISKYTCTRGDYLEWLVERNLKVRNFDFSSHRDDDFLPFRFDEYFQTLKEVEHVVLGESPELLSLVEFGTFQSLNVSALHRTISSSILIGILKDCPNLQSLNIHSCRKLDDTICDNIVKLCLRLTSFDCCNTRLNSDSFEKIINGCPNLVSLKTYDFFSDNLLRTLAIKCPYVVNLGVHLSRKVTDDGMFTIAKAYPYLEHLNVGSCNISDLGAIRVLSRCNLLKHVDFSGANVTDETLLNFVHCPHITKVSFVNCEDITDHGMCSLLESCPLLECIDLWGCVQLSDITLWKMIQYSKHLKQAEFGGDNTKFSDFALSALIQASSNLSQFSCSTSGFSDSIVIESMKGAKSLTFDDRDEDGQSLGKVLRFDRSNKPNGVYPAVTLMTCQEKGLLSILCDLLELAPELQSLTIRNYNHICDNGNNARICTL